jgi:hypothetical protein
VTAPAGFVNPLKISYRGCGGCRGTDWELALPVSEPLRNCLTKYPPFLSMLTFRIQIGTLPAIGLTMGMYLFALVMIVLNLAAFGVGIRVPFTRDPAGGTRHARSLFRSSNSPRNTSGRWGLPRRLVSPEPYAKAEAPSKAC